LSSIGEEVGLEVGGAVAVEQAAEIRMNTVFGMLQD
jgi:hypothetical protein